MYKELWQAVCTKDEIEKEIIGKASTLYPWMFCTKVEEILIPLLGGGHRRFELTYEASEEPRVN